MNDVKPKRNNVSFRETPAAQRLKRNIVFIGLAVAGMIATGLVSINAGLQSNSQNLQDVSNKLIGNWLRPDGGYVIRIDSVGRDGQVQAGYFNPDSIHVSAATLTSQDETFRLFVELQDVGYPGSRYELVYQPDQDILEGTYFQANDRELYHVVFVRKLLW